MVIRVADLDNVPGYDDKITAICAELTGHDPAGLAYVLVVTSWDERGQSLFANTSSVYQMLALMLAVLHTATRPWISGERVQVIPPG